MAKPTSTYEFATNPGTTIEPDPDLKATGFPSSYKPPAKILNWVLSGVGKWAAYLDNLHNEAAFLNKTYEWLAAHTFRSSVQVDEDLLVLGPIQSQNVIHATGNFQTEGNFNFYAPPTRTVRIPLIPANGSSGWQYPGVGIGPNGLYNPSVSAVGWINLGIRHGCTLTGITATVNPDDSSGTVTLKVYKRDGSNIPVQIGSTSTSSGTAVQTLTIGTVSEIANTASYEYGVQLTTSAAGTHTINSVTMTFTDPGPRNY